MAMTVLRWCERCQTHTAHHDYMPTGTTWIGNRQVDYDADWQEIYCAKCGTITIHYFGDPMPSDPMRYPDNTTAEGTSAQD